MEELSLALDRICADIYTPLEATPESKMIEAVELKNSILEQMLDHTFSLHKDYFSESKVPNRIHML